MDFVWFTDMLVGFTRASCTAPSMRFRFMSRTSSAWHLEFCWTSLCLCHKLLEHQAPANWVFMNIMLHLEGEIGFLAISYLV